MADRMVARANSSGATGAKAAAVKSRKPSAKRAPPRASTRATRKPAATFGKKTIALVYDFDGTLSPRPMQEYAFLPTIGENAADFWTESNRIAAEQKADPMITYMHLLYKKAKARNVTINRDALVQQGFRIGLAFLGIALGHVSLREQRGGQEARSAGAEVT